MSNENEKTISIRKVALILDMSAETIRRWYKWYDLAEDKPKDLILPEYDITTKGTKMFDEEGVKQLIEFKRLVNSKYRGIMSDFNAKYQWGKYGKKVLEKRAGEKDE